MTKGGFNEQSPESKDFEEINKFKELFIYLNSKKFSKEYRDAYEETVGIAKNLVDTKSKSSWDATSFGDDFVSKYPNVSVDFVDALKRCVENYNPPVNLPSEPLWE